MNEQLEEIACLYVLDRLDPSERAVFESRLLREPDLAAFVRDLESTLAHSVHALPQHRPPAGLLQKLEREISPAPTALLFPPPVTRPRTVRWANFARWGIAAAIAVSLSTIAIQSLRPSTAQPVIVFVGFDANQNTFAELPLQKPAKGADARFIQLASLAENYWAKPDNLPIKHERVSTGNRGYALYDPTSNQGFVAIEQLPAIAENQRYHLWIVDPTSGEIRDAGILPLAGTNRGLYSFSLESESDSGVASDRPNFFVTIEETNSPAPTSQPRGKVVLGDRGI